MIPQGSMGYSQQMGPPNSMYPDRNMTGPPMSGYDRPVPPSMGYNRSMPPPNTMSGPPNSMGYGGQGFPDRGPVPNSVQPYTDNRNIGPPTSMGMGVPQNTIGVPPMSQYGEGGGMNAGIGSGIPPSSMVAQLPPQSMVHSQQMAAGMQTMTSQPGPNQDNRMPPLPLASQPPLSEKPWNAPANSWSGSSRPSTPPSSTMTTVSSSMPSSTACSTQSDAPRQTMHATPMVPVGPAEGNLLPPPHPSSTKETVAVQDPFADDPPSSLPQFRPPLGPGTSLASTIGPAPSMPNSGPATSINTSAPGPGSSMGPPPPQGYSKGSYSNSNMGGQTSTTSSFVGDPNRGPADAPTYNRDGFSAPGYQGNQYPRYGNQYDNHQRFPEQQQIRPPSQDGPYSRYPNYSPGYQVLVFSLLS